MEHSTSTGARTLVSIFAFVGAIVALMISFALVNVQYGGSDSAAHSSLSSSSEFSSGTPLP